jgi:hypothetical protein
MGLKKSLTSFAQKHKRTQISVRTHYFECFTQQQIVRLSEFNIHVFFGVDGLSVRRIVFSKKCQKNKNTTVFYS